MKNGKYIAQFSSNVGGFGNGVVEVNDGRVAGRDDQYRYDGQFNAMDDKVHASITVQRLTPSATSIFGPVDRFSLDLEGEESGTMVTLKGSVVGRPDLKIGVCLSAL